MKKLESIFLVSLFFVGSLAQGADPVCSSPPLSDQWIESLARIGRSISKQALMSKDLLEMEKRIARLHEPACGRRIWPEHKFSATPLRLVGGEAVFQFNSESNQLDFLRPATDADKRIKTFAFENPPEGDGGTALNMNFFAPKERPKPPPPGTPIRKPACADENKKLMDFLNANTPPRKGSSLDSAFELLAHESFHNVDQNPASPVHEHTGACKWQGSETDRILPGDTENLKFYRQNTIAYLKRAFDAQAGSKERDENLAQAKAWIGKLAKEFPEAAEKLKNLDRIEGAAEYAGSMANALAKKGCDAPAAELRAALLDKLSDRYFPVTTPLDSQSYLLGALAGFLMDEGGDSSWKESLSAGRAQIDLLLESKAMKGVKAVEPKVDPTLAESQSISQAISGCMQTFAENAVSELLEKPQDFVLVQMEEVVYSSSGFFPVKTPAGIVTTSPQTGAEGEKLSFSGARMIRHEGLCGGKQANFVAVPRALVGPGGKIKDSPDGGFKGSIPAPESSRVIWNKIPVVCR